MCARKWTTGLLLIFGLAGAGNCVAQKDAENKSVPSQETEVGPADAEAQKERAEAELKREEHQRILGIIPNFNTSFVRDAAPLTSSQKFRLAFRSAIDPFQLVAAGLDAGLEQALDNFHGYGQGAAGYGKRFGAAYLDSFNGTMLGNAVFPALLHQDPRYFRKGTGSFSSRLLYAMSTTVRIRSDKGKWMPNYSNILGNLAAGGIANAYYPQEDRGAALTIQRAVTVTAEGAIGAVFVEFWPDIAKHVFHRNQSTP